MIEEMIASTIIGDSLAVRQLRARILQLAPLDLAVLIQGPTGAGKELVAQALHTASRRSGDLVAFNVCAVSESMFEDALFGHVKGAFTGATHDFHGYLVEAHRGTIFLDEISGLSLTAQAKLLRAIETKCFRPVGARSNRTSDFRVVSATNEDVAHLVQAGRFRADLAHRLSGLVLDVPPLRERLNDIPLLVSHFLDHNARKTGIRVAMTAAGQRALMEHHWPGNVRELKHVIERAVALSASPSLDLDDVRMVMREPNASRTNDLSRHEPARRALIALLEEVHWDAHRVAEMLGRHRATIYRRMKRLAIQKPPTLDLPRKRDSNQRAT